MIEKDHLRVCVFVFAGPDDDMFAPIVTPVDEIHPVVVKVSQNLDISLS